MLTDYGLQLQLQLELDVLPNINHMQAAKIPPTAATEEEWCRLLLRDVICNVRVSFHRCWRVMGVHSTFLSPVTLTFDLDRTG